MPRGWRAGRVLALRLRVELYSLSAVPEYARDFRNCLSRVEICPGGCDILNQDSLQSLGEVRDNMGLQQVLLGS